MKMFARATGNKKGELFLYEGIGEGWFGGISASKVSQDLKALGKINHLDIYINSPGGSVFDGVAIYNQLIRFDAHKVTHVDGLAASIASIILMAGDERRIAKNGQVMIHDPWGFVSGTAEDFRRNADVLDQTRETLLDTYVSHTKASKDQISKWMTDETWFKASDAKKHGFVHEITEQEATPAAFAMLANYKNVPDNLKRLALSSGAKMARMDMAIAKFKRA